MRQVTGFVPPIATPMRDGALDLDSLRREIDYLAGHVSGFLVGGSVGEHPNLTLEEREATLRVVARHKAPSHFLAASIADNCLENSRRLAAVAGELGADVLMVSCPNYYTNDRAMLTAYFARLGQLQPQITVFDGPSVSPLPPSLSQRLELPVRLLLGLLAGVALCFLLHYLDDSIHSRAELEQLGLEVLAEVPGRRRLMR